MSRDDEQAGDGQEPSGVRVLGRDGQQHLLGDLVRQPDRNGLRRWLARVPADVPVTDPIQVHIDVLPARTEIVLEFESAALRRMNGRTVKR